MIRHSKKRTSSENPFVLQSGKLKYGNFAGRFRRDWVEEAFTPTGRGEETINHQFDKRFVQLIRYGAALVVVLLLSRLGWLQVAQGEYYRNLANGNRLRLERLEASRGTIYDQAGHPLVHNVANFLLYCVPADLPTDTETRHNLFKSIAESTQAFSAEDAISKVEAISPSQLEYYQPFFLADNLPYEQALGIYLQSFNLPGIVLANKSRRAYTLPSLSFSHAIGYTGKINEKEYAQNKEAYAPIDYIGKTGLEKSWEEELRGTPGVKKIEVTASGKEKTIVSETPSVPGHDLILSIDSAAQQKLEEIMTADLKKINRTRAAAIVLNPQTGEIIASVSLPAFDNNAFARGVTQTEYDALQNSPDKPLFNRVVSGEYPSGSTIKPIIASAALEEKIINSQTSFLSTGGLKVGQWSFPDWKAGGHGVTNVRKAIAESVNTFFYYIGGGYGDFVGLGIDRMVTYLERFLLGRPLGIDLPNESTGFVPTKEWKEDTKKESWYIGDTYHVAIGQGDLLVTPLQVAAYTMYFANSGIIYKPHLVKEIKSVTGETIKKIEPEILAKHIISDNNTTIIREGLRETVLSGSARSLSALPVTAAGKTGTAQWSSTKATHAWFTGFAPYENPEVVITILVEEGGEGSAAATPIAREFLGWYFGQRQVE